MQEPHFVFRIEINAKPHFNPSKPNLIQVRFHYRTKPDGPELASPLYSMNETVALLLQAHIAHLTQRPQSPPSKKVPRH